MTSTAWSLVGLGLIMLVAAGCTVHESRTYRTAEGHTTAIVEIERVSGYGLVADREWTRTRRGAHLQDPISMTACEREPGTTGWICTVQ